MPTPSQKFISPPSMFRPPPPPKLELDRAEFVVKNWDEFRRWGYCHSPVFAMLKRLQQETGMTEETFLRLLVGELAARSHDLMEQLIRDPNPPTITKNEKTA